MGRNRVSGGTKTLEKYERNNKTIALNVLYIPRNTKTKSVAYRSEYNNKRKKQVILLMITNGKNLIILLKLTCLHCFKESHQITKNTFIV